MGNICGVKSHVHTHGLQSPMARVCLYYSFQGSSSSILWTEKSHVMQSPMSYKHVKQSCF